MVTLWNLWTANITSAEIAFSASTKWLVIMFCNSLWVASQGWVTPGVATEGVTPLFFPEKPGDLFLVITVSASSAVYPCLSSPEKLTTFFLAHHCPFLLISLRCHPPGGCHPAPFLPVRPRFSTIPCKFAHKIFFLRVSAPPLRVSPGAASGDTTAHYQWRHLEAGADHPGWHHWGEWRPNESWIVLQLYLQRNKEYWTKDYFEGGGGGGWE